MTKKSDETLITYAADQRSKRLAQLYTEKAQTTECSCGGTHKDMSRTCPKAQWQQAARMAALWQP